ncbi:TPR repeat protein [Nostoc sp. NIES-2111]|nr:TPR repeat protein [Nostoc sp. NIES-2111]
MFNKLHKSTTTYWQRILFFGSLSLCLLLSNLHLASSVNAQTSDAAQLVNLGITSYKKGNFPAAIEPWKEAINLYQKNNDLQNVAIINENLARVYHQLGQTSETLNYWEKVIAYYRTQNNLQKVGRVLTEIAQVYSNLGQAKKAVSLICGTTDISACPNGSALQIAQQQKDKLGEIAALGSLGEAYRLQGNYDLAIKSLETAKKYQNPTYNVAIFNSLGNAHASLAQLWQLRTKSAEQYKRLSSGDFRQKASDNYKKSQEYFLESIKIARQQDDNKSELKSHLNLIKLAYLNIDKNTLDPSKVTTNIQQAGEILTQLPDSTDKVYAAIDLANLPAFDLEATSPLIENCQSRRLPEAQVTQLFNQAIEIAQSLQDARSQSYALGAFGHFYECRKNWKLALNLTNQAIWLADDKRQNKDSLYLWEWQAGRILEEQGKTNEALEFYQRAYNTLEELRNDILTSNRDFQFDFRDVIEPVYRQLAEIQLNLATSATKNTKTNQQQLSSALATINALRLAEIQNYFGNDCILANINNTNQQLTDDTAVISSIIFGNKTGIIINLPNQEEYIHWINKDRKVFNDEIANFRKDLLNTSDIVYNTASSENLYDLLIKPLEKYLVVQQIKTLVFVQDSFLRNVPMAALYDKQQKKYLIEKYAVATTSSLQLTNQKNSNLQTSDRALVLAVSKEAQIDNQYWRALYQVPNEIKEIQKIFLNSKKLENEEFNQKNLETEIKKQAYPIVHISTHAQFGIIPEDTFLVAGNNQKLTINDLEKLLRQAGNISNSVELLTLTACETATGDDRATLGLAGVALQAGAKSALASLWTVYDESTADVIADFYKQLRNSRMSKAQALQAAQIKLINAKKIPSINDRYTHPYYWSGFILIGNWL